MRRFTFLCAAVGLGYFALASITRSEMGQGVETERIADLVKQLGHDQFAKREAASKALAKVGEPALAQLRKAGDSSEDAEVHVRASRLVEAIENDLAFVFNGKNLTGWRGLPECWTVKEGVLVGTTPPRGLQHNTFLCSKNAFTDFELQFRVHVSGTGWAGNSGVQIRSEIVDSNQFRVKGPQCDIGERYWGDLHDEPRGPIKQAPPDVVARILKPGDFNDYFIRCVGKHVTIKLNGTTTVDDDIADLPASGIIAWQLHGSQPMTVTFKNVKFTDLSRK